jgi:hypothetical protein
MKKNQPCLKLLRERVERNYEDYKEELAHLDPHFEYLFKDEVSAVCEAYFYLTTDDYISESDAAFLLMLDNPLETIANCWEDYKADGDRDFSRFLCRFTSQSGVDDGSFDSLADELTDKYGEDIPLSTACLLELVEMGKRLFRMEEASNYEHTIRCKAIKDGDYYDEDDFGDEEMDCFEFESDESDDGEGID